MKTITGTIEGLSSASSPEGDLLTITLVDEGEKRTFKVKDETLNHRLFDMMSSDAAGRFDVEGDILIAVELAS